MKNFKEIMGNKKVRTGLIIAGSVLTAGAVGAAVAISKSKDVDCLMDGLADEFEAIEEN